MAFEGLLGQLLAALFGTDQYRVVVLSVRCDAQLDVCGEGQQALLLLSQKNYDLVISDRDLPGVSGLDVLRSVRQRRRSPVLPFILVSSRNDSASVREVLPLAPTAYLTNQRVEVAKQTIALRTAENNLKNAGAADRKSVV